MGLVSENPVLCYLPGATDEISPTPCPPRKVFRFENVLYHAHRKVPVDVIVYYDPTYEEPRYLLDPSPTGPF